MKGRLSWLRDIKRVKGVYVSPPVSSPCQVYTAWVTGHWPCYSNCKKQLLAQDSHMQGREKKKKSTTCSLDVIFVSPFPRTGPKTKGCIGSLLRQASICDSEPIKD